jgi:FkbM family methyltransferase
MALSNTTRGHSVFVPSPAPRIRRKVAHHIKAAQPSLRRLAAPVLRSALLRGALNGVEERAGQLVIYPRRDFRVSDAADFLFHTNDLASPFSWTCRFADATFRIPVDPAFPHPFPHNDPWGPATYWRREENRKIRQFYETYLHHRPSGTFLDAGANWGCHSYPFAASGYRCVAFEPQSICCDFMARVREFNPLHHLTIVRSAVGSHPQAAMPFFESEVETFSSVNQQHVRDFKLPWRESTVECVTLDSYCSANGIVPTLIKIDTEGFECEVVRGGRDVFREYKPGLLVEVSSGLDEQYELWRMLADAGYRCYAVVQSLGRRYPQHPFLPVNSADEFVSTSCQSTGGQFQGDRDFIFLQPSDDVFQM